MAKGITVCIPCYEMAGRGAEYLERNLASLAMQAFRDFDVVVSDNSEGYELARVVDRFRGDFDICYVRNPRRGASANYNCALRHAGGKYVRFLAQDDWLAHEDALFEVPDSFGKWTVVGADDNPEPVWTGDIHHGNNRLGGPSCLIVSTRDALRFDESLTWLFDCDLYRRMFDRFGEPKAIGGTNYRVGKGEHQLTNVLSDEVKDAELAELRRRYD